MKFTKIALICLGGLALFGCNSGGTSVLDEQTASVSNGVANISIDATGCKGISSNGGTCSVNVTYSAPASSPVNNSSTGLIISGLNNYKNNAQQCNPFTTTQQECTITITSQASTSTAQIANLSPSSQSSTIVSFTVGGGNN